MIRIWVYFLIVLFSITKVNSNWWNVEAESSSDFLIERKLMVCKATFVHLLFIWTVLKAWFDQEYRPKLFFGSVQQRPVRIIYKLSPVVTAQHFYISHMTTEPDLQIIGARRRCARISLDLTDWFWILVLFSQSWEKLTMWKFTTKIIRKIEYI